MQEKDSPKFLLGEDAEAHDGILHNELQELKMEKLSHRVTLLTILIPCMIGIILTVAYLDIKDRVTRTQDTGVISSQKLAKDIESKFSSLSLEQAKIKDTLSKLPSLEDSSAFVQSRMKNMQNSLNQLESSSISMNELSPILQDMNDKYSAMSDALETDIQNLKTANGEMAEDSRKLSSRLDQISESLQKTTEGIKRIDESIASMENKKISKNELDFALRLKEIANEQSLLEAVTSLEKKIHSLEEKVRAIQKNDGVSQQNIQGDSTRDTVPVEEGASGARQETKKTAESAAPVQTKPAQVFDTQPSSIQSENIVEQNIE